MSRRAARSGEAPAAAGERAAAGPLLHPLGIPAAAGNSALSAVLPHLTDPTGLLAIQRSVPPAGGVATGDLKRMYQLRNYVPPTKLGMFDVFYEPATAVLNIVCRVDFQFRDKWTEAEQAAFKLKYFAMVNGLWEVRNHTFWCQEQGHESLTANPYVSFVETTGHPHYTVMPLHNPQAEVMTSQPVPLNTTEGYLPGKVRLRSTSVDAERVGNQYQVAAFHEAGHMLGLDDEYVEPGVTQPPKHDELVYQELGHHVSRGDDQRAMSTGMQITNDHLVTLVKAVEAATGMDWGFTRRRAG